MQTTVIHSILVRGFHHVVTEYEVERYKPEVRRIWEFRHDPYVAGHAVHAGRLLNQAGLLNAHGIGDPHATDAARAHFIAQQVIREWNRLTPDGAPMPVTPETIATLPVDVLLEFGHVLRRGSEISKEDLVSLKA
jgi:hypothetical protein